MATGRLLRKMRRKNDGSSSADRIGIRRDQGAGQRLHAESSTENLLAQGDTWEELCANIEVYVGPAPTPVVPSVDARNLSASRL